VPDYVRPSLRALGIGGFKIPQWETRNQKIVFGDEYERLSVATYATHDHKPLRALWEEAFERPTTTSEQSRSELEKIAFFAGLSPKMDPPQLGTAMANKLDFEKDFYPAIMEALFKSNAWIAIVMIADLLARKYRFNVPGTKSKWNWTRRTQRSIAQLRSGRKERKRMQLIHELLEKAGRTKVES
jgi:4-alpha-glucanotransferase